jgi:hypothetical protein
MDGYQFIAALVGSLVWPLVFVWVVWIFRKRLRELLPLLRLKHSDWEASFERLEKVAATEAPAVRAAQHVDAGPPALPEEQNRFSEVARISPRAAIMELRRDLELAARRAIERRNLPMPSNNASMMTLLRVLKSHEVIDGHLWALLNELRNSGNAAVHAEESREITKHDAHRYKALADQALAALNAL